ncbi:MAG TPA: shikimate kinase [Aggregatilineales bacterium]|nr:shikimate kinase [Aggregatilineales bacterium]
MSTPKNIILCGFMGTGKSTVGRAVAAQIGWRFIDTDHLIERRTGRSVSRIFEEDGEPAFRAIEARLCTELAVWRDVVIATGGGIVLSPVNRANLVRAGMVICLEAPAEEIAARLAHATDRPLIRGDDPVGAIRHLMNERAEAYAALPYHLNTAGGTIEEAAARVIALWKTAG